MPSPTISTKTGSIAGQYLKRTAQILGSATGEYFQEAVPTVVSVKNESVSALRGFQTSVNSQVLPKVKQLSFQVGFRKLNQWFLNESNNYSSLTEPEDISWDTDTDASATVLADVQVTAGDRQTNQLSKTMIDTSHKLVEAQISATANMMTGIEHLGATMTAGFDTLNATMSKLLEVTTKNSAALIEITAASGGASSSPIQSNGKLDLANYRKMIENNLKNSQASSVMSMAKAFGGSGMLTPEVIIGGALKDMFDAKNPKLKKNLQTFDATLNELVMSSLIRLGEKKSNGGALGMLANIFGIKATREKGTGGGGDLNLKPIQFNTLTQEAVVNVVPGYLQRILKQLGGDDVTYDYKSRQFRTKASMQRDHQDKLAGSAGAYRRGTSSKVKAAFGGNYNDANVRDLLYELMIDEFGAIGTSASRSKMNNKSGAEFVEGLLKEVKGAKQFKRSNATDIQNFASDFDAIRKSQEMMAQLITQSSAENVARNKRLADLERSGGDYHRDPKTMKDSGRDRDAILRRYGISTGNTSTVTNGKLATSGVDYSNMALYEIQRMLSTGINVYEVGRNTGKSRQGTAFNHAVITPPGSHRPKGTNRLPSIMSGTDAGSSRSGSSEAPVNEDGSRVTISGNGVKEWGKANASDIKEALFSGDPNRIRDVTVRLFNDTTAFAGDKIKKFFGAKDQELNFSSWLKESLFGKRKEDDDGKTYKTSRGILGSLDEYIFGKGGVKGVSSRVKDSTTKWFKEAAGYFNNGTGANNAADGAQVTRSKILGSSIGMVAGLGFLGGPLGLIAGGLVGNALAGTEGIGSKIKDMLFGKDYTDKNNKQKHKLGILERVVNSVTDPIRYQLGKTATALGMLAKKNILGPLANLGEAIKDRVANAAATKAGKVFGWIFDKGSSLIQSAIMAPFKLVGLAGKGARGAAAASTGAFGGAINFLSDRIAVTDEAKARLREKRSKYSADYDATKEDSEFYEAGGQKAWIAKQNEKRKNRGGISGIMAEEIHELVKVTKDSDERRAEVDARVSDLAAAGLERGSIFTHDDGIHSRLDQIISLIGNQYKHSEEDQFANSMAGMGTTAAMSGTFNKDDADDATALTEMAAGKGVSKANLLTRMKSIFKRNIDENAKGNGDEGGKKEGSILSTLMSGAKGLLSGITSLFSGKGGILALVAGAMALLNKDVQSWIMDGGDKDNAVLNAVTQGADVRTPSAANYFIPGADLYHVDTDAAGNDVTNRTMTHAKDVGVTAPIQLSVMNRLRYNAAQQGADTARVRSSIAGHQSDTAAAKYTTQADAMQAKADRLSGGSTGARVATNVMTNMGASMAVGAVAGKAAGSITTGVLQRAGVSEEWAERGGRAAETVTQVVGTAKAATGKGVLGWVKDKLLWLIDKLIESVKKSKTFGKVATVVTSKFSKVTGMITEKMLTPLMSKISMLLAKMGIETTLAGVTLGASVAVMAGVGAIVGGCNVENLFGVLPGDADSKMGTIATFLGAIFGLPYVSLIELVDLIVEPTIGKGVRQLLAEVLYVGISTDQAAAQKKMDALTEKFNVQVDAYNEKFGTDISGSTFNDMVNRGLGSNILRGGTMMTKEGGVVTDEAGAIVSKGGLTGLAVGRTGYAHDADGNVIFKDGKAVTGIDANGRQTYANKLDKYGNEILDKDGNPIKDKRWGNYVGDAVHAVGGFLGGKTTYKTDDKGEVMYDKDGNPIVEGKEKNIFGKIGDAAVGAKDYLGELFFGKKEEEVSTKDGAVLSSTATSVFGKLSTMFMGSIGQVTGALDAMQNSGYELDEDGKPLLDADGNKIPKGGIGNYFNRAIGGIGSTITKSIGGIMGAVKEKGLFGAAKDGLKSLGNSLGDLISNITGGNTKSAPASGTGYGRGTVPTQSAGSMMSLTDRYIKQLSPPDVTGVKGSILPGDMARARIRNIFYQRNYSNAHHMADAGCGPISASFMSSIYGRRLTPIEAATIMSDSKWRDSSGATSTAGIEAVGKEMGINLVSTKPDLKMLLGKLKSNEPVILLGKGDPNKSPFTKYGHFVVATGIDNNGNVSIMDPLSQAGRKFSIKEVIGGLESMTYSKQGGLPQIVDELTSVDGKSKMFGRSVLKTFAPKKISFAANVAKNMAASAIDAGMNFITSVGTNMKSVFGKGGGLGPGEKEGIDLMHGFPIYHQGGQAPWAQHMYSARGDSKQTMASSACGPTSMAMVLAGATGRHYSPYQAAQFALKSGDRTPDNGTAHTFFDRIGRQNGLVTSQSAFNNSALDRSLAEGKPVIVSGTGGTPFTSGGHYITVVGKSGDRYLVNDPNAKSGEYATLNGAREMWSFNKRDGSPILGKRLSGGNGTGDTSASSTDTAQPSTGLFGAVYDAAKSIVGEFNRVFGLDALGDDGIPDADRDPENNDPAVDSSRPGYIAGPVELLTTAQVAKIQTKREAKEIIDLQTMKIINFSWAASAGYHSDLTPMSPADVRTIQNILHPSGGVDWNNPNSWSWNGRPGVLKLNGRYIACGFHLRPHAAIMGGNPGLPFVNKSNKEYAYSSTQKWPIGGHICCYYGDSVGGTQSCNAAAKEAYRIGNEMYKKNPSVLGASTSMQAASGEGIGGGNGDAASPLDKAFKVTSPFGPRNGGKHNGIDLVPSDKSRAAMVRATVGGTVAKVGNGPTEGNYVTINGADGHTYQFFHLKSMSKLTSGTSVSPGTALGEMGSTGRSTGPHLHYGIKKNGAFVNPANYLNPSITPNTAVSNATSTGTGTPSGNTSIMGQGFAAIKETFGSIGQKFMSLFGLPGGDSTLSDSNYSATGTQGDLGSFKSTGGDTASEIYNFLIGRGCSTVAACAVLGNAKQESGLNPAIKQHGGGPGRGLFQWEEGSGRFQSLCKVAQSNGKTWDDLGSQLVFLWSELNTSDINNRFKGSAAPVSQTYKDAFAKNLTKVGGANTPGGFTEWMRSTNLKLATSNFEGAYERAGTPNMANRWAYAQEFYDRFSKEAKATPASSGMTPMDNYDGAEANADGVGGPNSSIRYGPGGIGGPNDAATLNSNFATNTTGAMSAIRQSKTVARRSTGSFAPGYITSTGYNDADDDSAFGIGGGRGSRANLQVLEQTLSLVLGELQSINDNTYGSRAYLGDISQKDFGGANAVTNKKVSQVLQKRQQQQKDRSSNAFPYNARNVSSVMSIVRPT